MISSTHESWKSNQLSGDHLEAFLVDVDAYGSVYEKFEPPEQFLLTCRLLMVGTEVRRGTKSWTKSDLKDIAQAKRLQQLMSRIEMNTPDVEERLRCAMKISDEVERVESLCRIPGIGPSVASAILMFTFPETYASLNYHTWNALSYLGFDLPKNDGNGNFTVPQLVRYFGIIRKMARAANTSPMEMGEALHALDKVNVKRKWKEQFDLIDLSHDLSKFTLSLTRSAKSSRPANSSETTRNFCLEVKPLKAGGSNA